MALRKVVKILLYCGAGILGIVVLLMLAIKLALDRAPQYQAEIKDWVHDRIGYRIAFAHVSPAFSLYGPELYFDQLELRSEDGQRVLARAAGGRIGADLWQLLQSGKLLCGTHRTRLAEHFDHPPGARHVLPGLRDRPRGGDASHQTLTLDDFPAGSLVIRRGRVAVQGWKPGFGRTWNCGTSNWICTAATGLRRCSLPRVCRPRWAATSCDRHGAPGSAPSIRWSGP